MCAMDGSGLVARSAGGQLSTVVVRHPRLTCVTCRERERESTAVLQESFAFSKTSIPMWLVVKILIEY